MRAPALLWTTLPRIGVLSLAFALCASAACVIGPKPDDPLTAGADTADANKQGDDGPGDFTNDTGVADTGVLVPAADSAIDTGAFGGGVGCDGGDGGDAAPFDGASDGGCPSADAASDAASGDALGDAPGDVATEGG